MITGAQLLTGTWSWHPSVLIGCLALLLVYWLARPGRRGGRVDAGRAALFTTGVAALCFSLVSPLDSLGDDYLFSAHMLQHLLILQVTPLLLIGGIPPAMAARWLRWPLVRRSEHLLRSLPLAWLLATVTLFAWHLPSLYNAALANENVHILEHVSFLVTAVIFWWPILSPLEDSRAGTFGGVFYLFTAMAATAGLGIFLTFTPPGLYPAYLTPPADGITALLRQGWGLTPRVDQQVGGLLMWVGGGSVYLVGLAILLARWYRAPETEDGPEERSPGNVRS